MILETYTFFSSPIPGLCGFLGYGFLDGIFLGYGFLDGIRGWK
jgi:hypothetical protein